MHLHVYSNMLINRFLTSGLQIIFVVVLMIFSFKFVNKFTEKLICKFLNSDYDSESKKRVQTLRSIIKSALDAIISVVGIMIILEKTGINIGPMLAAAGVVGLAVGFGSQRLVEDVISGFIILVGDQIRVGDFVKIGDKSGHVEKIDLQMLVLRNNDGNVHFIRNGKIDFITNMTKDYSCNVFDIAVLAKENFDNVIQAIKKTGDDLLNDSEFKDDIIEPVEILGLDKFDNASITIKARIKTKPGKQWAVGREFNFRLKNKFDDLNIQIP